MKGQLLLLSCAALAISMMPPNACAQTTPSRSPDQQTAGTASIRGRVTAADSGQPLRHAQVSVSGTENRVNRSTATDAEGRYEFIDVPAGRYNIYSTKGGYVRLSYGQTRPQQAGKPLEVLEGQRVDRLDFALVRGSVIAGRILDEYGDPVPDATVTTMRFQTTNGRRRLAPSGRSATSNDIGEFRIFGIDAGQYYLSATARYAGLPPELEDRPGYAQTYFPGTPDATAAQQITVGAGRTFENVVIPLVPARLARVTGSALNSSGRPLTGSVRLDTREFYGAGQGGAAIRPDGTFTINDVAPGDYVVIAESNGATGDNPYASANITVGGEDVSGVQLITAGLISATGRVVVDPALAQSLRPGTIRIGATPADLVNGISFGPGNQPSYAKDDFTFEMKVRPGRFRIFATGLPDGWTTRAVRYRGVDVTDAGIEFTPQADLGNIEIELTSRTTTVTGLVNDDHGKPTLEYTVLVFAQDRDKWAYGGRYSRTARPDQDGRFKITGLPPGDYSAIALESIENGSFNDPEFFESVRSKATPLSLNDGETKTVDLRLNSAQ
jgi:hypothetical protein